MDPYLQSVLSSFIRWALLIVAGYLVKHGIWSEGDVAGYVTGGTAAILGLAWSLWTKYHDRIKLLTGLMLPAGSTENDITAKLALGGPVPSVTTPPSTPPGVPKA